uniref:Uncharacterized protein n=1 Tax=Lotus japonicus TaxID=34305 RepID=I3T5D9_LOTJA|nr:unknown [Lotus japonicus]
MEQVSMYLLLGPREKLLTHTLKKLPKMLLHPKPQGHCNLRLLLLNLHIFIVQIHHLCLEHQLLVCLYHLGIIGLYHHLVCHQGQEIWD